MYIIIITIVHPTAKPTAEREERGVRGGDGCVGGGWGRRRCVSA